MIAETQGTFQAGHSGSPVPVTVVLDDDAIRFHGPPEVLAAWPLRRIRLTEPYRPGQPLRLHCSGSKLPELSISDGAFIALLMPRLPFTRGKFSGGRLVRPLGWLAASFLAVALLGVLVLQLAPDVLASAMPERWRQALGDWSERNLVGPASECRSARAQSAIAALVSRFAEARPGLPPLAIKVYDISVMNAFALPGDRIVLTRGLLDKSGTPDEVAGVLAHEIGHAVNRHSEAQVIRAVGLQMLFSLLSSGQDSGTFAGLAAELRYSRDAEAAADDYALALLAAARIDPMGLKHFFELVLREEQEAGSSFWNWGSVLSTHPITEERIRKIAPLPDGIVPRPALEEEAWRDLKAICG